MRLGLTIVVQSAKKHARVLAILRNTGASKIDVDLDLSILRVYKGVPQTASIGR